MFYEKHVSLKVRLRLAEGGARLRGRGAALRPGMEASVPQDVETPRPPSPALLYLPLSPSLPAKAA